uniref:Uncharacterized protein n=1 Tax=Romanomermis culicivorax TaxID=13658 RepID=A0A915KL04_ROMCU
KYRKQEQTTEQDFTKNSDVYYVTIKDITLRNLSCTLSSMEQASFKSWSNFSLYLSPLTKYCSNADFCSPICFVYNLRSFKHRLLCERKFCNSRSLASPTATSCLRRLEKKTKKRYVFKSSLKKGIVFVFFECMIIRNNLNDGLRTKAAFKWSLLSISFFAQLYKSVKEAEKAGVIGGRLKKMRKSP